jgi:hypothetical protein
MRALSAHTLSSEKLFLRGSRRTPLGKLWFRPVSGLVVYPGLNAVLAEGENCSCKPCVLCRLGQHQIFSLRRAQLSTVVVVRTNTISDDMAAGVRGYLRGGNAAKGFQVKEDISPFLQCLSYQIQCIQGPTLLKHYRGWYRWKSLDSIAALPFLRAV